MPSQAPSPVEELLRALAGVDFGRVDVALRVDGEVVDPVELAGAPAVAAEAAQDAPGVAEQVPHDVVLAVRGVEKGLRGVRRKVGAPHRAGAPRVRRYE